MRRSSFLLLSSLLFRRRFLVFVIGTAGIAFNAVTAQTASESQSEVALERGTGFQARRDGIDIQASPASLRITALRDDILRVRIAPGGASWAVLPSSRSKSVDVQPVDVRPGSDAAVGFRTAALDVRVERNPLRL